MKKILFVLTAMLTLGMAAAVAQPHRSETAVRALQEDLTIRAVAGGCLVMAAVIVTTVSRNAS